MTEQDPQHSTVLDSDEQQVGTLYARALLGSAGKSADSVVAELESVVAECLDKHPALEKALSSPRIKQEEKEALLDRIFSGRIDKKLLNFFKVLCRRDRIGSLRTIQSKATEQREVELGKQRITVTTAKALTDSQKSNITKSLKKAYGNDPLIIEVVDESLIGGIVIRIGDEVIDGSIVGRMASVRSAVTENVQKALRDKYESLISS